MFSFFKKEKWALVKSFKLDRKYFPKDMVYHIHCFESEKGSRKAEYLCEGKPYNMKDTNMWLHTTDIYQMQIYRWLNGRRDPEIPTYEQIGEEDTANFLKGKVS
jgi:hypothetical protein